MAITAESLTELIAETQKAYEEVQNELHTLEQRVLELNAQREALAIERQAFVSSFERRYPGVHAPGNAPAVPPKSFDSANGDWSLESRSEAVERAVRILTDKKGFATPADIEELLHGKNREDTRDAIGAALAYLNRSRKVHSRARAQWVHGDAA